MWIKLDENPHYAVNEEGALKNLKTGRFIRSYRSKYYNIFCPSEGHKINLSITKLIKDYFPDEYEKNIQKIFTEMNKEGEEWKEHPEYPNYAVSNQGRVFNLLHLRFLKERYDGSGYARVALKNKEGELKQPSVHRLVAECFIPNPDPKHLIEVDHIDHNRVNNISSNLRWLDHKTNIQERTQYGSKYYVLPERRKRRGRPPLYIIKEGNLPKEPVTDPDDPYFWM